MSAGARVNVTFTMEYQEEAGSWGDDCTVGQLRKQATDGARGMAERVIAAAAEHARVKLTIQKIGAPIVLLQERDR